MGSGCGDVLVFLLLVAQLQAFGQLVQALAVVELNFAAPAEKVLELLDQRDLRFHAHVQASQLFVELQPDVCSGVGKERVDGTRSCLISKFGVGTFVSDK